MPRSEHSSRRTFVGQLAGAAAALALPSGIVGCAAPTGQRRPNIVLVMADDLGYGDVGFTGRTDYATPNIDRIAREGVVMRQSYSAAPVCTPTRVALLTGRYPAREPVGLLEPLTSQPVGLPADPPTLPRLMRDAGYETALVGKWHLGTEPQYHPLRHGFDEFYGFLGAAADYVSHEDTEFKASLFRDGEVPVTTDGYLTDLFTDRAERIIERPRTRPLLLTLQYNAPHWPWQAPGDGAYADSADPKAGGSPSTYAGMMTSLDRGVGRVLGALKAAGMDRDTVLVFTSDNGGERFSHMGPFSHGKMTLSEGGIRVATAVRWPGTLAAGSTTEQVSVTMDWAATFLALAGAAPQRPSDGIDLLPALRGEASQARELGWRITQRRRQKALRMGDLKLLLNDSGEHLYDVVRDPGEGTDLSEREPAMLATLRARLAAWEGEMLEPVPLDARFE